MKVSIIKRVLASALALALVVAPVINVQASNMTGTGSGSCTAASKAASKAGISSVTEIPATSSVAGVTTSVTGVYLATKVSGTAITTPMASISAGYSLASNEKAYAKFADMDTKKSYLAMACINAAAASQKAEVGPCIDIELGKMTGGEYSLLPASGAAIRMAIGIPANFVVDGKTYAMVRVREGGVIDILADVDTNLNTITFDTTGGAGAYAIIRY